MIHKHSFVQKLPYKSNCIFTRKIK